MGKVDFLDSPNKVFRLSFINFDDCAMYYLGIQCTIFPEGMTVWVANRDNPLKDIPVLQITPHGDLLLHDNHETAIPLHSLIPAAININTTATLLDTGNFILKGGDNNDEILWQSFHYPSNTLFPGMQLGLFDIKSGKARNVSITSWLSPLVPARGAFRLGIDPNNTNQLAIWRRDSLYWQSGNCNGHNFSFLSNFQDIDKLKFKHISNEDESYYTFTMVSDIYYSLIEMNSSGDVNIYIFQHNKERQQRAVLVSCDKEAKCMSKGCINQNPSKCSNGDYFESRTGALDHWDIMDNRSLGLSDCQQICTKNCSCNAYATFHSDGTGCQFSNNPEPNAEFGEHADQLYYKRSSSKKKGDKILHPPENPNKNPHWIRIIVQLVILITVASICALCYFQLMKSCFGGKKGSSKDATTETETLKRELNTSIASINELRGTHKLKFNGLQDIKLPLFSFSIIETATRYFSNTNKLGEGGFGPVYKGILADGQEIAVKRLSKRSRQGPEEFKNEVMLISKLQHRNLVRLLGCCIKGQERILVYEYLPNKSLDSFLFDAAKRQLLDWRQRVNIIAGIAQGLLYLHKYSRLKIIHRDLKTSNILLDSNMRPKISDFGTAKIFGEDESSANTVRIVGTYGYMPPEYAMDGIFSEKSDVFSFGVMMLEILSGKKNNAGFHQSNEFIKLSEHAWHLWKEGRCSELMDPAILGSCTSMSEFIQCVKVGLLCVQENAADRPTMADVVSMLGGDMIPFPDPKQPAFSFSKRVDHDNKLPQNLETYSLNDLTISSLHGR
ncbi:receptor-like serine/threonine-protein kinase SD1-8 [Ziziphus jujuba]|uniref:Receptor-like serine/threonine-protein kinase n=1 Tax=Ziziphus jujuba TaxID=326968 RepID=A0A6P4AG66_ZIZJJ|nr:receptor-like serine/threonine-protein kinase SD1-8 [Ziziphus jujuba]